MKSVRRSTGARTVLWLFAVMICAAMMWAAPAKAASAQMRKAKVSWTLQKGKLVSFYTRYTGVGMQKMSGRILSYEVTDSSREGYKEATIEIRFTRRAYSKAQIKKMRNASEDGRHIGGSFWVAVTDYDTGKYLGRKNKQDVSVYWGDCEYDGLYSFHDNDYYEDGEGIDYYLGELSFWKSAQQTVKIIYPENYKGLCLGFGGYTKIDDGKKERQFWKGSASFAKTSYWNKSTSKRIAYFMRIE